MSQAFVKEGDAQWLHEIAPTMNALLFFLASENNGIRVHEKRNFYSEKAGMEVWEMSNGLAYGRNSDGKWMEVLDF